MGKHKKRRSKKITKGDYELELPLSVHAVMSNDDLLIEILLRLPVISLHMFKFVSKRWLSLITATNITLRQLRISKLDPPTGFFYWRPKRFGEVSISQQGFKYDFVSLDTNVPSKRSTTITMGSEAPRVDFLILQSCNGLLLLGCDHNHWHPCKFYICNPFLKLFKMLPQCDDLKLYISSNVTGMILGFDPTRSPHYKVIKTALKGVYNGFIQIVTYFSEIDNWCVCRDRFPYQSFYGFKDGIYWNDAIHWINFNKGRPCSHFKLEIQDVHHPVLTTIQTPVTSDTEVQFENKLFSSRGCLLILSKVDRHFNIYQMINENAGWSLKYVVDLHDIMEPFQFPRTHRIGSCGVLFVVLGERDEDSFLVVGLHGKVVQYKIVLKTVRHLCEYKWRSTRFQFIASLAGV